MNDYSSLYSSLPFMANDNALSENSSATALNALRLNALLNNNLDTRQTEPRRTIDSSWNDIGKTRNINDVDLTLGRLLAQTYSYSSESSISPQMSRPRSSPVHLSCGNDVFPYGDDSPQSNGSAQSFSYSSVGSSGSSLNGRGLRMPSLSDTGSPTLDDAILMGCVPDSPFTQNSPKSILKSQEPALIDLMNSLSLNNSVNSKLLNGSLGNISSNRQSSNSVINANPLSKLTSNNGNILSNSLGFGSNGHSPGYSGISESLAQLQNMWLTSQLCPGLLESPNLLAQSTSTLSSILPGGDPYAIEKAAKMHRNSAAMCDATCTWSGQLPTRVIKNPFYSCKVFLGGVPWDVTEFTLRQAFIQFGSIQVEWPGKENSANPPKGYVYILFENEKQVQVIPWLISDSNYVRCPSYQLDPAKTVFVGALHGMLTAEGLANIMNDLFGGVVYTGIDTDKHKYPIGSGRVTFNNVPAYKKAVKAAFIEIKTSKFTKKVQVDPYLADSMCQSCSLQQGPYFCRNEHCFKYYCRTCWHILHTGEVSSHKPLMRDPKLRLQRMI